MPLYGDVGLVAWRGVGAAGDGDCLLKGPSGGEAFGQSFPLSQAFRHAHMQAIFRVNQTVSQKHTHTHTHRLTRTHTLAHTHTRTHTLLPLVQPCECGTVPCFAHGSSDYRLLWDVGMFTHYIGRYNLPNLPM